MPDEDDSYRQLRHDLSKLLPADASGSRRPASRDAANVYRAVGQLLNERLSGRAGYGERVVARLAADLQVVARTLYRARRVADLFPDDLPTGLTWSHCRVLVTIEDATTRQRLLSATVAEGWSVRQLQEQLQLQPVPTVTPPTRSGTYRIVTMLDEEGDTDCAFDLGFGIRRPLRFHVKPGKKTRRLMKELAPGDVVECTRDDKGRPALRRVHGQVESRLYVAQVHSVQAVATGTVTAQLDLGFDVTYCVRLRLNPPATLVKRPALEGLLGQTDTPLLARTVSLPQRQGWGVDLFQRDGAGIVHLNDEWANHA